MRPGTGNSGGWRSPQASAGTPSNTREPARSGKKKPQPRTVGVLLLVDFRGIEVSFGKTRKAAGPCGILRDRKPAFDPLRTVIGGESGRGTFSISAARSAVRCMLLLGEFLPAYQLPLSACPLENKSSFESA